jgi:hypothetical protein
VARPSLAEFSALHPETPVNAVIQMDEPDFLLPPTFDWRLSGLFTQYYDD